MTAVSLAGAVGLLALVAKLVDVARYARDWAHHRSAVVTQLLVWGVAIGVVMLYAQTQWASTVTVDGLDLARLDLWSLTLLGLVIGSTASLAVDLKQAIDNADSARKPPLLGP